MIRQTILITSIISFCSGLIVLLSFFWYRKLRKFPILRLIAGMVFFHQLDAASYWLSYIPNPYPNSANPRDNPYCLIQASIQQFCGVVGVFFVLLMSWRLRRRVLDVRSGKRQDVGSSIYHSNSGNLIDKIRHTQQKVYNIFLREPYQYMFICVLGLLTTIIAFPKFGGTYEVENIKLDNVSNVIFILGKNNTANTNKSLPSTPVPTFCWISRFNGGEIYRLILYYIPLFLAITLAIVFTALSFQHIRKRKIFDQPEAALRAIYSVFGYITVAVLCYLPMVIKRCIEFFFNNDIADDEATTSTNVTNRFRIPLWFNMIWAISLTIHNVGFSFLWTLGHTFQTIVFGKVLSLRRNSKPLMIV